MKMRDFVQPRTAVVTAVSEDVIATVDTAGMVSRAGRGAAKAIFVASVLMILPLLTQRTRAAAQLVEPSLAQLGASWPSTGRELHIKNGPLPMQQPVYG